MIIDNSGKPISNASLNKGLLVGIIAGAVGTVFVACTGQAFLAGFARKLGASQFQIGLLSALGPMSAVAQILSSYLIERKGWHRKPILCICLSITRSLWVPILLLPFIMGYTKVGVPTHHTVTTTVGIVLAIMAISQLLGGLAGLAWQAWMGDLVPPDRRGRYFGVRTTIMNAVNAAVGLFVGHYLDKNNTFVAFGVVFGIGALFGVLDLVIHAFVPEPKPAKAPATEPFMKMCLNPFKDYNFRGFLFYSLTLSFATWIMLPFVPVFQIETLKMSYLSISWLGNVVLISVMLASPFMGKLVDRVGGRLVFIGSYLLLTTIPIFWLSMNTGNAIPMHLVMNTISGIGNAGVAVASTKLLYESCPPAQRSVYIAIFFASTGIAGTIGPMLGGWIGDLVAGGTIHIGALTLGGLKVVFGLSLLCQVLILPLLVMVREGIVCEGISETTGNMVAE